MATPPPTVHYPIPVWPLDIINGIVLGDYTRRLGVPGRITQAVLGFVPVVGSLCAIRDLFACRGKKDSVGVALNALAIFPFLGGFPKTAAAVHGLSAVGQVIMAGKGTLDEFAVQRVERAANTGHQGLTTGQPPHPPTA